MSKNQALSENEKRAKTPTDENNPFVRLRKSHNLTQSELIKKLSEHSRITVSQARISDIEHGNTNSIDRDLFDAYIKTFGVSADYLLGYTNDDKGRVDVDAVSCADYLGLNLKSIQFIKQLTDSTPELSKRNTNTDNYFYNMAKTQGKETAYYELESNYNQLYGFMLECFLSIPSESFEPFFSILYNMVLEYYKDNYVDSYNTKKYTPQYVDNSYRSYFFDIQNYLWDFVEHSIHYDELKKAARDYDARNGSNVYDNLFGNDSGV